VGLRVPSVIARGVVLLPPCVQVGSIGTVLNRLHLNRPFDYIILDEAHHAVADTWRQVIGNWPDAKVLG